MSGAGLPGEVDVLRVVEDKVPFFDPPGRGAPPAADLFRPTPGEERAARRGECAGVSVFDRRRATPAQVVRIRERMAERRLLRPRAFSLNVDRFRRIARTYDPRADAVADPLTAPGLRDLPGADGHALLLGLTRPPGSPRAEQLDVLVRLARAAEEVDVA